jgi:hypothetical protein
MYTAASLAAPDHYEEAMQFLSEKVSEDSAVGSLNVGSILAAKAGIHCYAGNLDGVEAVANRAPEIHKTVPVPDYWLAHHYYFLGAVAYERNLLDLIENYFGRVEQSRTRCIAPAERAPLQQGNSRTVVHLG